MKKGDKALKAAGLCAKCGVNPRLGYTAQCNQCRNTYNRGYFRINWRKYHLRKYGLTEEEYNKLLAEQDGRCAICQESGQTLAIDHSHFNGRVRGLLCNNCNNGLGRFKDSPLLLGLAKDYLERT